jgi:hypothetical protein
MLENTSQLSQTIDAAIMANLQDSPSQYAVVAVRSVARVVMYVSGASADDYTMILQLVCEHSIRRGHVLAFTREDVAPEMH